MECDKQHFRHILLFYYRKGKNAVQARKKLTDEYGEGVLTVRQWQNRFPKFRFDNFDVEDALRSGRPVEADKDAVKALVDANRRITTREIGLRLNVSNSTVYDHLKGLGLSSKLNLLPDNTTINSEVYCHQLDKLNDALQQKMSELINRKCVVFHQDNARPHTSLVTHQKLLQLEWDTMPLPPYSPDLAPSDYYLFRSLQNFLEGKTFTSNEEIKNLFDQFFASKVQKFNERGIMLLLPERWQKSHAGYCVTFVENRSDLMLQNANAVLRSLHRQVQLHVALLLPQRVFEPFFVRFARSLIPVLP
ncbi:histone-lysine N-methyltransferase SETMAR [Trichonephila clavipes]|nr:histone-lysine N-methyltransferase SETMAR [Trichonephila clavipes]